MVLIQQTAPETMHTIHYQGCQVQWVLLVQIRAMTTGTYQCSNVQIPPRVVSKTQQMDLMSIRPDICLLLPMWEGILPRSKQCISRYLLLSLPMCPATYMLHPADRRTGDYILDSHHLVQLYPTVQLPWSWSIGIQYRKRFWWLSKWT